MLRARLLQHQLLASNFRSPPPIAILADLEHSEPTIAIFAPSTKISTVFALAPPPHPSSMRLPMTTTMHGSPRGGEGGLGLKTVGPIAKGSVVLEMSLRAILRMKVKEADAWTESSGLPHDAGVELEREALFVTDWRPVAPRPKWHLLNHCKHTSAQCNLLLRWNKHTRSFQWIAKKRVGANVELTFDYGDAPATWA